MSIPSQLVLSLFPGIDLLGRGFEAEGISVVRGPDLVYGSDIRDFHVPPGRFDGVIGGSPCPDFSKARRTAPTGNGLEMLEQYRGVVLEARPVWWLLENVAQVPDLVIDGYSHQRIDINASECGLPQNRLRHFQFGHRDGHVITVNRQPRITDVEPCCTASEGVDQNRRDWRRFCQPLRGLPSIVLLVMAFRCRWGACLLPPSCRLFLLTPFVCALVVVVGQCRARQCLPRRPAVSGCSAAVTD